MLSRLLLLSLLWLPLGVGTAQAAGVGAGQIAPAVDLPLVGGATDQAANMSLAQLRGNVVYLDFWASWCGPCRLSFPQLDQLHRDFSAQGFVVLAVNVDEFEADALAFLQEIPVSYPVVRDAEASTPRAYGILGMPTGYLIDRQGVIRLVHQGFRKHDGEKLRAQIIELLAEDPP